MKFTCSQCGTHYLISDEKVGDKGVKVRCKRCGNVIPVMPGEADTQVRMPSPDGASNETDLAAGPQSVATPSGGDEVGQAFDKLFREGGDLSAGLDNGEGVDEDGGDHRATEMFNMGEVERLRRLREESEGAGGDASGQDSGPPASELSAAIEWHVAIGSEQQGPISQSELEARWTAGVIDGDTLVWSAGMDDWQPMQEVPRLSYLLLRAEESLAHEGLGHGDPAGLWGNEPASPAGDQDETRLAPSPDHLGTGSAGISINSLVAEEMKAVRSSPALVPEKKPIHREPTDQTTDRQPWEDDAAKLAVSDEGDLLGALAKPDGESSDSFFSSTGVDQSPLMLTPRGEVAEKRTGLNKWVVFSVGLGLVGIVGIGLTIFLQLNQPTPAHEPRELTPDSSASLVAPKPIAPLPASGEATPPAAAGTALASAPTAAAAPVAANTNTPAGKPVTEGLAPPPPVETGRTPAADPTGGRPRTLAKKNDPAGVSPSSPPKPGKEDNTAATETLSKEQIAEVIKGSIGAMKGCVEEQQKRDSTVTGTMAISFVIENSGKVGSVTILTEEHRGTYVAGCISYIVKQMRFPKFKGEPITIPKIPLRLGG